MPAGWSIPNGDKRPLCPRGALQRVQRHAGIVRIEQPVERPAAGA